jgi:hypothetical protein
LPKNYDVINLIIKLSIQQQNQIQLVRDDHSPSPQYSSDHPNHNEPLQFPLPNYPTDYLPPTAPVDQSDILPDELTLHNAVMMSASAPPVEDPPLTIPESPILPPQNDDLNFPGYPIISNQKEPDEIIECIDFRIHLSKVDELFNSWKKSLWFPPQSFVETAVLKEISPVLVPHWLFSTDCVISIKANVLELSYDPVTRLQFQNWKDITLQKSSHLNNLLFLGVPEDVVNYNMLLESTQNWDPSFLKEKPTDSTLDYFRSFFSEVPSTKEPSDYPKLPHDTWTQCFDKHCRQKIEELEIEPSKNYLHQKGYLTISNVSVKVIDLQYIKKTLYYLPLYICLYQYYNYFYTIIINGVNGTVKADRPYNSIVEIISSGFSGLGSYFRWYK